MKKINLNIFKNKDDNFSRVALSPIRRAKDIFRNFLTMIFSLFSLSLLVYIVVYICVSGGKYLTWDFITSNYNEQSYTLKSVSGFNINDDLRTFTFKDNSDGVYQSKKWGVSFKEKKGNQGNYLISIHEVCANSYFNDLIDYNNKVFSTGYEDTYVFYLYVDNENGEEVECDKDNIEKFVETLDSSTSIGSLSIRTFGGGIRGSLLSTLYLVLITLLIALPIGTGGAIYLSMFSKKNLLNKIIRSLIDMTSAIPSIIFGFLGILIFIPFINSTAGSNGSSILAGSLTLVVMLIPTIVKTTEESIIALPKGYMDSSLALGASKTETIFKIILPNALPGIVTSIILSIGRIIGESAALIFVMGTSAADNVLLNQSATTLSTHIWMLLNASEVPNYGSACAVRIIILIIVFILSALSKIVQYRYYKKIKRA
ncbi:MAG TPA: hypothetical protein DD621_04500 [Clostridiales bacterium]|nr:hypothetical protein [Clostridiales bacterium]